MLGIFCRCELDRDYFEIFQCFRTRILPNCSCFGGSVSTRFLFYRAPHTNTRNKQAGGISSTLYVIRVPWISFPTKIETVFIRNFSYYSCLICVFVRELHGLSDSVSISVCLSLGTERYPHGAASLLTCPGVWPRLYIFFLLCPAL